MKIQLLIRSKKKIQLLVLILVELLALILVILRNHVRLYKPSGGWYLIEDINDPHVIDIVNFAVSEFNKQTGATLKFEKVIEGEYQLVAGINYHLVISTSNSVHSIYNVVVYDWPLDHVRNLESFIPVIDDYVLHTSKYPSFIIGWWFNL
jgi:cystatin-C